MQKIIFSLLFLISVTFCSAQKTNYLAVTLYIMDDKGNPLEFAEMDLSLAGQIIIHRQTSEDGKANFNAPIGDDYSMYIIKKGFITQSAIVKTKIQKKYLKDYILADTIMIYLHPISETQTQTTENEEGAITIGYFNDAGKIEFNTEKEKFEYKKNNITIDYTAKLLVQKNDANVPLQSQGVSLIDDKNAVIQTVKTNESGDFTFEKIGINEKYEIVLQKNPKLSPDAVVSISTNGGKTMQKLAKNKNNEFFVYAILPSELYKIAVLNEESDAVLNMKKFTNSDKKETTVKANIYYGSDASELLPDAKTILDEVVEMMKSDTTLYLELSSHTDSRGDDNYNLKLSEKRAKVAVDYLVSKGINPKHINGKGLGETKILNKCLNGIDCNETEHKVNRRTEFKFTRKD